MIITETARLQIRELERNDTPALSKILGDPYVMEFSSKGALSEAETLKFIDWCNDSYHDTSYGQWALIEKQSGQLIGFTGLSQANVDGIDEVEVAYRLATSRWGNGLASEAVHSVLEYGFTSCNLPSIIGIVSPQHKASNRVLEKSGFEPFTETQYSGWTVRVYRLTKSDWMARNA